MTGADFAVGLIALATGLTGLLLCLFAWHIPGLNTLTGAEPYTAVSETDTSWLRELPAIDTNSRTAQAARRNYDNRIQEGGA